MSNELRWWDVGYRWFCLRLLVRGWPDKIAWWVAFHLPRPVALYAFVRVYGAWGELGSDYAPVYDAWNRAAVVPHEEPR